MQNATLSDANLEHLDLTGLDLASTNLRNARLGGAVFCRTQTAWGQEDSGCPD